MTGQEGRRAKRRTTPAEELAERLASANADRHRLEVLYEEARREQHRWEDIAAERGTRMDEIQARAEAAEAQVRRLKHLMDCADTPMMRDVLERVAELENGLREIEEMGDYVYKPHEFAEKARALLADSPDGGGAK